MTTADLQRRLGLKPDGVWGPNTQNHFLRLFVNKSAPAITQADMIAASARLGVPLANLMALAAKESGRASFSNNGRPVILFEAHWFSRLTKRAFDRVAPSISSRVWNRRLYALTMDRRYLRLAKAASLDLNAAISSASWGKFQIMGFHWQKLGYGSPLDFAMQMVSSEANHLDALVRFIEANQMQKALRDCRPNDPASCIVFSRRYNGSGYRKNGYHTKLARLIARFS